MNGNASIEAVHAYVDALLEDGAGSAPGGSDAVGSPAPAPARDAPPAPSNLDRDDAQGSGTAGTPGAPALRAPVPAPAQSARAALQPQRWVRVAVGDDSYALELLCVQEVVRMAPIVAMRGAGAAVLGVMNLRGRIAPVFDLGLWLGSGRVQPDERSRIVVIERDDELIGVLVSAVDDVVTLEPDRIEPPLAGTDPGHTLGVARVGAVPTVLLDAAALYI